MENKTPKRPTLTKDQIAESVKNLLISAQFTAREFAEEFSERRDSYEIAKALDDNHDCGLCREDLDLIDELVAAVDDAKKKLIQNWFDSEKIQPPYPVGTNLNIGVIEGIYEFEPAIYRVKKYGRTQNNSWRLIKFEDAVLGENKCAT